MTRESEIEQHLKHCTKREGGEVRKVKWIGRNGAPDRLVMLPQGRLPLAVGDPPLLLARSFFVELKRPGEGATPAQAREHERMRRCGLQVFVASTFEEVEELFK